MDSDLGVRSGGSTSSTVNFDGYQIERAGPNAEIKQTTHSGRVLKRYGLSKLAEIMAVPSVDVALDAGQLTRRCPGKDSFCSICTLQPSILLPRTLRALVSAGPCLSPSSGGALRAALGR
jgi:hypothetical protein